ncbi:MAG: PKD domain-containing protein [Kiritimatiellia bacterium]|jgi:hypothetical protein
MRRFAASGTARRACFLALAMLATGWVRAQEFPIEPGEAPLAIPAPSPAIHPGVAMVRLWPWEATPGGARLAASTPEGEPRGCLAAAWEADGPLDLLVELREGDSRLHVTVAPDAAPISFEPAPDAWTPQAGLVLETRPFPAGLEAPGGIEAMRTAWNNSGAPPFGRSLVPNIFHGIHPNGPAQALLARYAGWFRTDTPGAYAFAVLSDDASFLLVDGAPLAEWPGWHGLDDSGRRGERNGSIELAPGCHSLELLNAQNDAGFSVAAAWKRPGDEHFSIIPPEAIPSPVVYHASVDETTAHAPAAFGWEIAEHAMVNPSLGLVGVRFAALEPRDDCYYRWYFDDGAAAEGYDVRHVFSAPGAVRVRFEVRTTSHEPVASLERTVSVHPRWLQRHECPDDAYARLRDEIRAEGPAPRTPASLAQLVGIAEAQQDSDFLADLAEACHGRRAEFTGAEAEALLRLGFFAQHPSFRRYAWVGDFWRALLDAEPAPDDGVLARCRLHLAGFLIHTGEAFDEAARLLAGIPEDALSESDGRLRLIFTADIHAMRGEREAATALYRQAGTVVDSDNTAYHVRRLARLEAARHYLRDADFDAAEAVAREIEWECPLERLGLETGLILVESFRGRGEIPFALAECRRMLRSAGDAPRRPELLLAAARLCRETGAAEEMGRLLADLYGDYPYSESAAIARDEF